MPWDILQISPDDADARTVKRAYARLVKSCRPDRDPEGFQRLREAYETALAMIEARRHEDPYEAVILAPEEIPEYEFERDEPDRSPPPKPVQPERELPDDYRNAGEALQASLANGAPETETAFRRFAEIGLSLPWLAKMWGSHVVMLFQGREAELAGLFRAEDAVRELEQESGMVVTQVIGWLDEKNRDREIIALATRIFACRQRLQSATAGHLWIHLARLVGPFDFELAGEMVDEAYPVLSPKEREFLIPIGERAIAVGETLRSLDEESRIFWGRFANGRDPGNFDWSSQEARERIDEAAAAAVYNDAVRALVEDILPVEAKEHFQGKMRVGFEAFDSSERKRILSTGLKINAALILLGALLYVPFVWLQSDKEVASINPEWSGKFEAGMKQFRREKDKVTFLDRLGIKSDSEHGKQTLRTYYGDDYTKDPIDRKWLRTERGISANADRLVELFQAFSAGKSAREFARRILTDEQIPTDQRQLFLPLIAEKVSRPFAESLAREYGPAIDPAIGEHYRAVMDSL